MPWLNFEVKWLDNFMLLAGRKRVRDRDLTLKRPCFCGLILT